MTCQYCRAHIDVDAHRCPRCGRRTVERTPVQMTAAVPELETVEMPAPVPQAPRPQLVPRPGPRPVEKPAAPAGPPVQAPLFGPREVVNRPADTAISAPAPKRTRVRRDYSQQRPLHFPDPRTRTVERQVYCDAPVAIAAHRVMAAIIDLGMAVVAAAVFGVTFNMAGAEFVLTKATAPYYALSAVLILLFYRFLFCMANLDTPGLLWTGLMLVDFEGKRPTRKQRWYRLMGGFVGAIAAGIGLVWALVDAEHLAWHDHMSKTFPTPRFL